VRGQQAPRAVRRVPPQALHGSAPVHQRPGHGCVWAPAPCDVPSEHAPTPPPQTLICLMRIMSRESGGRRPHAAEPRRPPIPLPRVVARTEPPHKRRESVDDVPRVHSLSPRAKPYSSDCIHCISGPPQRAFLFAWAECCALTARTRSLLTCVRRQRPYLVRLPLFLVLTLRRLPLRSDQDQDGDGRRCEWRCVLARAAEGPLHAPHRHQALGGQIHVRQDVGEDRDHHAGVVLGELGA
jgi:hypothetical protein